MHTPSIWSRLWRDERGFLVSLEIVLSAVLLVFGVLAGMQALRDATIQELADLGDAISAINEGFVSGTTTPSTTYADSITYGVAPTAEGF